MNMSKLVAITVAVGTTVAALQSYADTNITEHVMLTEDADWTSLGTVNIAADAGIHLNGHNLTVAGFAGEGSIYSSVLPAGYAALEYIDSTGAQYIDTGVKAVSEVKIVADVMYTGAAGSYQPLISAAQGSDGNTNKSKTYGVWVWPVSGTKWVMFYNGSQYNSSSSAVPNERCTIEAAWKNNSRTLIYNGGAAPLNNTTTVNNPVAVSETMYLPARNLGGTVSERSWFKIYSFKIYNPQTTLVRNYVPAKRLADNAVGLYDMVSKTFFPSETETAFVGDTEIERGGGELRINVASGTFKNSTVAISNSVKVVKLGAGTYASAKSSIQPYTGGTLVSEGRITHEAENAAPYCAFGGWGTELQVVPNAQVMIENGGYQTLNGYRVTIAGDGPDGNGAIYGKSKKFGSYTASFLGGLSLSDDASIKVVTTDSFNLNNNSQGIDIELNGHTLTANGSARLIVWSANVVDEGRIVTAIAPGSDGGNNCFYTYGNGVHAPLADFEVAQGGALGGEQPLTVSNLVMRGTFYPRNGTLLYDVTVLGRYSPKNTSGGCPKIVMGDAAHLAPTLDLSDLSSAYDGSRGIAFAEGSAVTVYVGARTINVGDKLVSWSSQPDISVSFALTGDGWTAAEREIALAAREDGLYVKTTAAPAFATLDVANGAWLFFTADGTPYPEEWTQGVTSDMQVRFSSYEEYTALKMKNVSPSMFVMTGFTMPEGLGEVDATVGMVYQFDEGIVIDIKGNSLKLPAGMMFGDKAFTVTSSVAGGEVVIDVPSGTSRNTSMSLAGSLKVTKKGAGTFVSALAQTYTGGTDVLAGRVQPPDSPADSNYTYSGDNFTAFGTGMVNVLPGAVCNVRGNYAYTNVVLKGGAIANTLRTMSQTTKPGVFVASLADADVSQFNMYLSGSGQCNTSYGKAGLATDLGGKTLEIVEWGSLSLRSALTNGTVRVVESNGWFRFEAALDMRTATFDNLCAIQVNNNVDLGTYIQRKDTKFILGSGKMTIHERFVPVSGTYFYGCTMLDGSTLDLSQRDTLFTSSCTNHENKVYSVAFPASGTLNVEIGERRVKRGDQLVAWTAKPAGTAKFKLTRNGVPATGRRLAVMDDGLYVGNSGFILVVK